MLIKDGFGDSGGDGHQVHRRPVVSLRREYLQGHVEQLAAPAGGGKADDHAPTLLAASPGLPNRSFCAKRWRGGAFRKKIRRKRAVCAEECCVGPEKTTPPK